MPTMVGHGGAWPAMAVHDLTYSIWQCLFCLMVQKRTPARQGSTIFFIFPDFFLIRFGLFWPFWTILGTLKKIGQPQKNPGPFFWDKRKCFGAKKLSPDPFEKKMKKVTFETHVMSCYLTIFSGSKKLSKIAKYGQKGVKTKSKKNWKKYFSKVGGMGPKALLNSASLLLVASGANLRGLGPKQTVIFLIFLR